MTDRRPLVIVSGLEQELPRGDTLADPVLAAISQICGYTVANTLEVEAATKAMRMVLRERDVDEDVAVGDFTVGRYSLGLVVPVSATTAAISAQPIVTVSNNAPCIAFIKRITGGVITTALTGARTGQIKLSLRQYVMIAGNDATSNWILPPIGNLSTVSSLTLGNPYNGLRTNQPNPMLVISSLPGSQTIPGVNVGSKTWGELVGDSRATVGYPNIPPGSVLFDYTAAGFTPITIGYNAGFTVVVDSPAAATSQTISCHLNIIWDELQLKSPL